jgi:hypothetical protein
MSIGSSIALIAIGAILAFAVRFEISGLSLETAGYILMITGIIALTLTLLLRRRRAAAIHTHVPPTSEPVVRDHPDYIP